MRVRVIEGEITADQFVRMSHDELRSVEQREADAKTSTEQGHRFISRTSLSFGVGNLALATLAALQTLRSIRAHVARRAALC
jgi:hypothetical protein